MYVSSSSVPLVINFLSTNTMSTVNTSVGSRPLMKSLRVLSKGKLYLEMKETTDGRWVQINHVPEKKKPKNGKKSGQLARLWKQHKMSLDRA